VLLFVALLLVEKYFPYLKTPSSELSNHSRQHLRVFINKRHHERALPIEPACRRRQLFEPWAPQWRRRRPLKWLLSFILFDFAVYVWHLLGHKNEFLWRFHKIHHSDKSFHVTTGLRFHVFDQFLELLFKCSAPSYSAFQRRLSSCVKSPACSSCSSITRTQVFPARSGSRASSSRLLAPGPSLHTSQRARQQLWHRARDMDLLFRTRKELVPKRIGLDVIEAENIVQLFSLGVRDRTALRPASASTAERKGQALSCATNFARSRLKRRQVVAPRHRSRWCFPRCNLGFSGSAHGSARR